jgi:hypothetical protein
VSAGHSAHRLALVFVEVSDTLVDEFDLVAFPHVRAGPFPLGARLPATTAHGRSGSELFGADNGAHAVVFDVGSISDASPP